MIVVVCPRSPPKISIALAVLLGCGPGLGSETASSDGSTAAAESSSTISASGATTVALDGSGSASSGPAASTSDTTGPSADTTEGSETTAAPCDPHAVRPCDGGFWDCSNGMDDDGDGLVDLDDPECTSPCSNSEDTFAVRIPGDWMDCGLDCWFDGNSGLGDDGCRWDLRCDPLGPGENAGCPADAGAPLCTELPQIPDACRSFCEPLVPNGCDCFGCCGFETESGSVELFIGDQGSFGCSTTQLELCQPCTTQIEQCGNPCEPEACEICFSQQGPPAGCARVGCVDGTPCADQCDCGTGEYCLAGCCHPYPPG